jgi:hypothetical protein
VKNPELDHQYMQVDEQVVQQLVVVVMHVTQEEHVV